MKPSLSILLNFEGRRERMITIYGIPNCDIVKKAMHWFKENNIAYQFHNFKTQELSPAKLLEWINKAGLDVVVNKRSTTWRTLPPDVQKQLGDKNRAVSIVLNETSIIKRPIIETGKDLIIGFNETEYKNKFAT